MGGVNGHAGMPNGKPRMSKHRGTESQQLRDAEEFELEGLIDASDGEETPGSSESASGRRKEAPAA